MAISNVNIKFGVNMDSFRTSMQSVERTFQKTGDKLQNIGKKLSLGITLPIVALGAASLKSASDAEETFSKFDTVFGGVRKSAEEAFKTLRSEYGLSSIAAKDMLSSTGDLLVGFGFSQKAALDLSSEVNKLAVDLASFNNYEGGAAGASKALTSALLGEREALKGLGIVISENDVKKKIATMTSEGFRFASEKEAKAQATFQLALEQSGNALGDYERTKMSAANQTKLFWARLEDLRVTFGAHILPLFTKGIVLVNKLVEGFLNLPDSTKKIIMGITGIAAAVGPLLTGLGFLTSTIFPAMKAGLAALSVLVSPLALKIGLLVGVVTSLIVVGKGIVDSWDTVKAYFGQLWDKIKLFFIKGVAGILGVLNEFTSAIGIDFGGTVLALQAKAVGLEKALSAEPVVTFGDVISEVGGSIMNTFTNIKDSIIGSMSESKDSIEDTAGALDNLGGGGSGRKSPTDPGISDPKNLNPFKGVGSVITGEMPKIADRIREYSEPIWTAAKELTDTFNNIISGGISNAFIGMGEAIGSALANGASVMKSLGNVLLTTIGNIASELGKAAIAIGVGMIAIKAAFKNPITAIAAGVALVALGAFISSKVSKMTQGGGSGESGSLGMGQSVPGRAMGGTIQAGVPYMVGERGPELMIPSGHGMIRNAGQTASMGKEMVIRVIGELVGQGSTLKGIIDYETRVQGRTT